MTRLPDTYRVIGLMSGSSLDGLDIACCDFEFHEGKWHFYIPFASCAGYDAEWIDRLSSAHEANAKTLWQLHADFGRFSGKAVRSFINDNAIEDVAFIASHGHTIFHFPHQGFTAQIGDGAGLAACAGLPVICDFRSSDVAKSGQGAPLVPIGDRALFGGYKFLLNLGGIANITIIEGGRTTAFDICSANQVLDHYARQKDQNYDTDGLLAATGRLDEALLKKLDGLPYHAQPVPKSLDNGYSREIVLKLMEESSASLEDKLHTYCEHIAHQTARYILEFKGTVGEVMLVTGGGAFNKYLVERLKHYTDIAVEIPHDNIVCFKEALIFAFMGVLRWRNEVNVLCEVTGANADSVSGAVYLP